MRTVYSLLELLQLHQSKRFIVSKRWNVPINIGYSRIPSCSPFCHRQFFSVSSTLNKKLLEIKDITQNVSQQPGVESSPASYLSVAFYQFISIPQEQLIELQSFLVKELRKLEVIGRIYIAKEGINAQCSVPESKWQDFQDFFNNKREEPLSRPLPFQSLSFNLGTEHACGFSKLIVRIKKQLVATDIPDSEYNVYDPPIQLTPAEWHEELSSRKKAGVKPKLFDVRNAYEHAIGHFEDASLPPVATFRAGMEQLITETQELDKDEEIYMYCTGGIRCSKAGAILKSRGYSKVKMLKGGITAYGNFIKEALKENDVDKGAVNSLFQGQNFTFDHRLGETVTEEIISKCSQCSKPSADYTNCVNVLCNLLFIQCPECAAKYHRTCGERFCLENTVISKKDNIDRKPTIHQHEARVIPDFSSKRLGDFGQ